jgi:hypothetical protein
MPSRHAAPAVASTAGRVLRVPVEQVRVIMAQEVSLSELILRTFLLRHSILTRLGSGLTLIGSRFDAGTRRSWPRTPRWAARRERRPGSRTTWDSRRACRERSWRRARPCRRRNSAYASSWRPRRCRCRRTPACTGSALAVRGLFVFIGAKPSTGWLAGQLAEDTRGFLLTGTNIPEARLDDTGRMPLFLETSRPGVVAVGDVRSGSVKRTATAIGEG